MQAFGKCGLVALVVAVSGCGFDDRGDRPEPETPQEGRVGDTLTLEAGTRQIEATVLEVRTVKEQAGSRTVGVELELKNLVEKPYRSFDTEGAQLRTASGEQGRVPLLLLGGECRFPEFTLLQGDTVRGCIPFRIDFDDEPASFQYDSSAFFSGGGGGIGVWELR